MLSFLRSIFPILSPMFVAGVHGVSAARGTIENLQEALQGERNANARYLAFAARADEEGYGEVGSLFRATAKAEEIHAHNHAAVMRELGVESELVLERVEVKRTRQNLKTAIEGEKYERDVMYPQFIERAKREKESAALRTFTLALKVEAVHVVLYQDALDTLDSRKGKRRAYYVCSECGNTLEKLSILKCLICGRMKSDFLEVN